MRINAGIKMIIYAVAIFGVYFLLLAGSTKPGDANIGMGIIGVLFVLPLCLAMMAIGFYRFFRDMVTPEALGEARKKVKNSAKTKK